MLQILGGPQLFWLVLIVGLLFFGLLVLGMPILMGYLGYKAFREEEDTE